MLEFDPELIRRLAQQNEEPLSRPLLRAVREAWHTELTACQQKYLMHYYEDAMTMREIAERYGVNIASVSRTLKRARERLRRVLRYYISP